MDLLSINLSNSFSNQPMPPCSLWKQVPEGHQPITPQSSTFLLNLSLINFNKCLIFLILGDLANNSSTFSLCLPLRFCKLQTSSPCLPLPTVKSLSLIKQLQDPLDLSTIQVLGKALEE